ncbi:MAG: PBSX family phage terminase large subunit [Clostridiales bacterium]|nr:PBSX family phage terminase large subunit [Clostridiales bacterium]
MIETPTAQEIKLDELIAPAFFPVHHAVRERTHSDFWLMGGRGSCKSSFVSLEIILGLLREPTANAIIYRKVADTMRDSVYAQMIWALDKLGMLPWFQCKVSPMELIYKPTGQQIIFRGADDPQKSKGIKLKRGYFGFLWFEELTEFSGMEDILTIKASVIRGGDATTFYTYNPPMTAANWVNSEARNEVPSRFAHSSSYLDVPPAWLGQSFLLGADALRLSNDKAYRHMYLGEITGTGGQVFGNLHLRPLIPSEWESFPTYSGLDFGFATDPDTYIRCAHDRKRRILYIVGEFAATGQLINALAAQVRTRAARDIITCDSAEPRSIAALRALGIRAIGAKKGPDSIAHGIKWLQTLAAIVIDTKSCPFAASEFATYEYDRDKSGNVLPCYPDRNNHTIDAVRYAVESVSTRKTAIIPL